MVMGGDSCHEGRGFEFQHRILDGYDIFSHIFVGLFEKMKINEKEAGDGPFLKNIDHGSQHAT